MITSLKEETTTIESTHLKDLFRSLNSRQREAVYAQDKQLLCLAGAGTGKTHALICRIIYLTEILKVHPKTILVLTFTNSAGQELQSRYFKYSSSNESPYFGTFHSFCYQILLKNKDIQYRLGYTQGAPEILSDYEEAQLKEEALLRSGVKLSKKAFDINFKSLNSNKFEHKVLLKTFRKLLIKNNKITFDMLSKSICELFIKNDNLISKYIKQYSNVFVDEFQDTDNTQWRFIQSFELYSSIFLIGDIRQNIYSFRGSSNAYIKELCKDKNWKVIKLEYNYRSYFEICDFANTFLLKYNDDIDDVYLQSNKYGGVVNVSSHKNLKNILDEISSEDTAILCRTNEEVKYVSKLFSDFNIQYTSKLSNKLDNLAKCAVDTKFCKSYLISLLSKYEQSIYLRNQILNIENKLQTFSSIKPEIAVIEELKNSENFDEIYNNYTQGHISLDEIMYDSTNLTSSIYVGTIHSVKGLEFENVVIWGVNSPYFKVLSSEENMNLFYVAITRAKKRLFILTK